MRKFACRIKALHFLLTIVLATALQSRATDIVWTNTAGGNWSAAANWNPNQVPAANDSAFITNGGTYTVTLSASATILSFTLGGAGGTQTVYHTAGTLITSNACVVNTNGAYTFYNGTILGPGDLNVYGKLLWQNGLFDGGSTVNIYGTATLQSAFAQYYHYLRGWTIRNYGIVNNVYGELYTGGGCQIINMPGATWMDNLPYNAAHNVAYGGNSTFINQGTYIKTNTPYIQFNMPFHNQGTVRVAQGDLYFAGGGNHGGTFDIIAGPLGFNAGSNTVLASTFSGPGQMLVSGGTATFSTNFSHSYFNQSGGNAFFLAQVNVTNRADWSGGTAFFTNSSTIVALGMTNYITAGTINFNTGEAVPLQGMQFYNGTIAGTDTINFNGPLLWQNGFFDGSGDVNLLGASTLQTAFAQHYHYLRGRTIRNYGIANNTYGSFYAGGGCQIVNMPGATWTENVPYNNVHYNNYAGDAVFVNQGTFVKTNTPYLQFNFPFLNQGTVRVAQGDLYFAAGGNHGGLFDIIAGPMGFNGGSNNVLASTFSGAGQLLVSGGTATFSTNFSHSYFNQSGGNAFFLAEVNVTNRADWSGGNAFFTNSSTIVALGTTNYITAGTINFNTGEAVPLQGMQFYNGTIAGTDTISFNGPLLWQNGFFDGSGDVNLLSVSTLQTAFAQHYHYLRGRTIRNYGIANNTYGSFYAGGGCQIVNMPGATWTENVPYNNVHYNSYAGDAVFVNQGTFVKTNTPYLQFNFPFHNQGTTRVAQGDLYFAGGGNHGGLFDIVAGLLGFNGGSNTVLASTFSGPGKVYVTGGTATFATNLNHARYEQNGGTAFFKAPVNLSVSADIYAGNAYFTNGGTVISLGTTNYIAGGTFHFNTGQSVPLQSVAHYNGTIAGSDTININSLVWQNGFFDGSGVVNLLGNTTLQTVLSPHWHYLRGRTIRNQGTVNNIYGSFYAGGGCQLVNLAGATWIENVPYNNSHQNNYAGTAAFLNQGAFLKTNAFSASFGFVFTNQSVVTVQAGTLSFDGGAVQTAGSISMSGGGLGGSLLTMQGGTLSGNGSLPNTVANTGGTVSPGASPGLMTGNHFTNGVAGTINIELAGTNAPGTNYDQIRLTGTATLNGAMSVTLADSYAPQLSNSFSVMTFASRSGTFSSILPPPGVAMDATYNAGSVVLTITGLTNVPLQILTFPSNQTVYTPDPATFFVGVSGTTPISYQWQFNSNNIFGATNSGFSIPSTSVTNAGTYAVLITDGVGATTNASATLAVIPYDGTLYWTNPAGGNWDVAANWLPNRVPGVTNHAVITNGGVYTVTVNSPVSVGRLTLGLDAPTGQSRLNIYQNFTLEGPGVVGTNAIVDFAYNLFGAGSLTNKGVFYWGSGTMTGTGALVNGTNGSIETYANSAKYLNRSLNNFGSFNFNVSDGSGIQIGNGGVLTNEAGGSITIGAGQTGFSVQSGATNAALYNHGTITANGSPSVIYTPFYNEPDGTLIVNNSCYVGSGTNRGTIRVDHPLAGVTFVGGDYTFGNGTALQGYGTIGVGFSGILNINAPVTCSNAFVVSAGQLLNPALNLNANLTTYGSVSVRTGDLNITNTAVTLDAQTLNLSWFYQTYTHAYITSAGNIIANNLNLTYGTFLNSGNITVRDGLIFSGVTLAHSGNGRLTTLTNSSTTISKASTVVAPYLGGGVWDNYGTIGWDFVGILTVYGGAGIINHSNATMNLSGNGIFVNYDATNWLVNYGLIQRGGNASTPSLDLITTNYNTVLLNNTAMWVGRFVQFSGRTDIGGSFINGAQFDIRGGEFSGAGTIQNGGTIRNAANLRPGSEIGTLNVSGPFTNAATGIYHIQIGGNSASQYDRVNVGGTAYLAGTLNIALTNFYPTIGNTYTAMTYTARSGQFDNVVCPNYQFEVVYTPTELLLLASNALPVVNLTVDPTQLICNPFLILASATDPDGSIVSLSLQMNGNAIASTTGTNTSTTVELDYPQTVTFTALATDNRGGTNSAIQQVEVVTDPIHYLTLGGFRSNRVFKICMLGNVSSNYMTLMNTNIKTTNWIQIGSMQLSNGIFYYFDANTTNVQRYYKARQQ